MMTHSRLLELLRYDDSDGRFYWKLGGRGIKHEKKLQAGSFDAHGYGQIRIDGVIYKEHRLVWFYKNGEFPENQIDHINHDRRDNRFENLRLANNSENGKNRPKQRNNKSGHVGVRFYNGAFCAYINVSGKQIHLGRFNNIDEAINARSLANKKYGFHENHGVGFGISRDKINKKG